MTSNGAALTCCSTPEQPIELLFRNAVALARTANEAGPLQGARRHRNASPLHAESDG